VIILATTSVATAIKHGEVGANLALANTEIDHVGIGNVVPKFRLEIEPLVTQEEKKNNILTRDEDAIATKDTKGISGIGIPALAGEIVVRRMRLELGKNLKVLQINKLFTGN